MASFGCIRYLWSGIPEYLINVFIQKSKVPFFPICAPFFFNGQFEHVVRFVGGLQLGLRKKLFYFSADTILRIVSWTARAASDVVLLTMIYSDLDQRQSLDAVGTPGFAPRKHSASDLREKMQLLRPHNENATGLFDCVK